MEYPPNGIRISFVPQKGQALFTSRSFKKGEKIFEFVGVKKDSSIASEKALQIGPKTFLESTELFDDCLNHSCEPNTFIHFGKKIELRALRDISQGEELSYNYNTSEFDMVTVGGSFYCHCGTRHCQGYIGGYRYLSFAQKEDLAPLFAPYLKRKFTAEKRIKMEPEVTLLPLQPAYSS